MGERIEKAKAALEEAWREYATAVLGRWLDRLETPLGWSDDWNDWVSDAPSLWDDWQATAVPPQVTIGGCPLAGEALAGFRARYREVGGPEDLSTLKADQALLRGAIEGIREHARIVPAGDLAELRSGGGG